MSSLTNLYKRVVSKVKPEARLRTFLILAVLLVCSLGINMLLARRVIRLQTLVSRMKSESRIVQIWIDVITVVNRKVLSGCNGTAQG